MTAILVPRLNAQPVDTCMSVSSGDLTGDDVDRSRHGLFSLIARRDRARLECSCDVSVRQALWAYYVEDH